MDCVQEGVEAADPVQGNEEAVHHVEDGEEAATAADPVQDHVEAVEAGHHVEYGFGSCSG